MNLHDLREKCEFLRSKNFINQEKEILQDILLDWKEYINWIWAFKRIQELDTSFIPLFEKVKTSDGFEVYVSTVDQFRSSPWEPLHYKILDTLLFPGAKVIHLGGHIGDHDFLISKFIGEKGVNHVFEPNPETYPILYLNIIGCNLNNTILHTKGVWDKAEKSKIYFENRNTGEASLFKVGNNCSHDIDLVKLDAYLPDFYPIDLLFMDIEGAELHALDGAVQLLDRSPNCFVFMEWTPDFLKNLTEMVAHF